MNTTKQGRAKGYEGDACPDCGKPFGLLVCCKAEAHRIAIDRLTKLFKGDRARAERAMGR